MILSSLEVIRPLARTGGVFSYGAERGLAQWIESFTDSDQSHVSLAIVQGPLLMVAEAIGAGTKVRPVNLNWENAADMWYLPLRQELLDPLALYKLLDFIRDVSEREVPYDFRALLPGQWRNRRPPEDFSRLYCSELISLGFLRAGLYEGTPELTPAEVCNLNLYEDNYYCIKWGRDGPKEIPGYNTVDPRGNLFSTMPPVGAPQ